MKAPVLAVDIGAESGRVCTGALEGSKLRFEEIHRFPNTPVQLQDGLHWNPPYLLGEIRQAIAGVSGPIRSIGVDTWGVDFGLLDEAGDLIELPFHYRDYRTDGVMEKVLESVSAESIFEATGLQFLPFNTLYQLYSMVGGASLAKAARLLTMPDYLHYELTERRFLGCEFTIATTTQCFDPRQGGWAIELLQKLGIPTDIFPEVFAPGHTCAGGPIKVVLPASHDTGSAVAAIPDSEGRAVWISSGTWSIMGIEVDQPVVAPEALALNMTNEGGANGTYRLCQNVMGLWLVQECRRDWESKGRTYDYPELMALASDAESLSAWFDPDDPELIHAGGMVARIEKRIGGSHSPGQLIRAVLESLALKYRFVLEGLARLTGRRFERICIVGGGSRNRLLNQLTADVCGLPVLAGPSEATAIGNMIVQMVAQGELASLAEARAIVADSFECQTFYPAIPEKWETPYAEFRRSLASHSPDRSP